MMISFEFHSLFFDFISFDVLEIDFKEYNSYNSVEISSKNLINKDLINIFNTQDSSENHTYMNLYKFFNFPGNKNTNILVDGMSIWNTYPISSGRVEIIGFIPRGFLVTNSEKNNYTFLLLAKILPRFPTKRYLNEI